MSIMNIVILLNYGGLKMKKIIVIFTYLFIIFNIIGCSNINSSDFEKDGFYTLNKNEKIQIGEDIPEGVYVANILSADKSSLTFNIKNEDGSTHTLYAVSEAHKLSKGIYDNLQFKKGEIIYPDRKIELRVDKSNI